MKVIQTIQSTCSDDAPVEVQFYGGSSLSSAMSAALMAMDHSDPQYYRVLSVRVDFDA